MELERVLLRYGAGQFAYASAPGQAAVAFSMKGRAVRFAIPLPDPQAKEFTEIPPQNQWGSTKKRAPEAAARLHEQAVRQRWRAAVLVVKAKLEAVESGITTFEDEWLAYLVVPGERQTVGEMLKPQIDEAYT